MIELRDSMPKIFKDYEMPMGSSQRGAKYLWDRKINDSDTITCFNLKMVQDRDTVRLLWKVNRKSFVIYQHTHNHFTALLEYGRDLPGEQVPER